MKAGLHERLADDEQLAEDLKNLGFELKVNMVETLACTYLTALVDVKYARDAAGNLSRKDLRALTKRPCKFLKKGCRKGDKCRQAC